MIADVDRSEGELSLARLTTAFMPYIQSRACSLYADGLEDDDLVQEGLIGLYNAIESYDAHRGVPFRAYATTCIDNRMTSAVRGAGRKKHRPLSGYLSLSDDGAAVLPGGETPEELAIARESYVSLQNKIQDELSPFEREVLSLYLDGSDYLAIAKLLDVSAKSVDNALQRARKKLRPRQ